MGKKEKIMHWADQVANRIIHQKGEKNKYVVAAGITPSGTVHIGNFREIITVDLVARALKDLKKEVRFIYSWDDFDVFRKVPKNMPNKELLEKYLRKPITKTPDTFDCKHENYARHNEIPVEKTLPKVDIFPEFIYQAKKYTNCDYAEGMKIALLKRKEIKKILDKYRIKALESDWYPISIFCEKCEKDEAYVESYDGKYKITYKCGECKNSDTFDIRKSGLAKLNWRIDWPMRWQHESVDFEPGGKDHSATGGSRQTGEIIAKEICNFDPPVYQFYEWIGIKGGGQFSSSEGVATTLQDVLDIYEPSIVRFLFAGTRPNAEFAISFDLDVLKIYEDFDKCERIYYKTQEAKEKEYEKQKRIYELSAVGKIPKKMPFQPSFRHLTNVVQIYEEDTEKILEYYKDDINGKVDKERLNLRANCAINWLKKYAPENMKFKIQEKVATKNISKNCIGALKILADKISKKDFKEKELHEEIYEIAKKNNIEPKEFFKSAYLILINKEQGPKLANFILTIGKNKVIDLFNQL